MGSHGLVPISWPLEMRYCRLLVFFYRWATDTAYRPYSLQLLQTYCRQQKGRRYGKAYRTSVL
jgi:hypothetical protein